MVALLFDYKNSAPLFRGHDESDVSCAAALAPIVTAEAEFHALNTRILNNFQEQ